MKTLGLNLIVLVCNIALAFGWVVAKHQERERATREAYLVVYKMPTKDGLAEGSMVMTMRSARVTHESFMDHAQNLASQHFRSKFPQATNAIPAVTAIYVIPQRP